MKILKMFLNVDVTFLSIKISQNQISFQQNFLKNEKKLLTF